MTTITLNYLLCFIVKFISPSVIVKGTHIGSYYDPKYRGYAHSIFISISDPKSVNNIILNNGFISMDDKINNGNINKNGISWYYKSSYRNIRGEQIKMWQFSTAEELNIARLHPTVDHIFTNVKIGDCIIGHSVLISIHKMPRF